MRATSPFEGIMTDILFPRGGSAAAMLQQDLLTLWGFLAPCIAAPDMPTLCLKSFRQHLWDGLQAFQAEIVNALANHEVSRQQCRSEARSITLTIVERLADRLA